MVEDGNAVVIRQINNTCCNGNGFDAPVQWFNYMHKSTGSFLTLSPEGQLSLQEGESDLDSQKWRLDGGKLFNKGKLRYVLGQGHDGILEMVSETSDKAISSLAFEDGNFVDRISSSSLALNGDKFSILHNIAKREAAEEKQDGFIQLKAGGVTCPELNGWPAFKPFKNNPANTQCWEEIQPSFRLYTKNNGVVTHTVIANAPEHLTSLPSINFFKIKKLVVVIHGFDSNANVGEWPHKIAEEVLKNDDSSNMAALTVNWEEGAEQSFLPLCKCIYILHITIISLYVF